MSDQNSGVSPFEAIKHTTQGGGEYWSGRELAKVLGYTDWRNFVRVIRKAAVAIEESGHSHLNHIVDANEMVEIGSGAQREREDFHLSRYACYLVVQNADPDKPIVALGQTYFAVQTRRAELAEEAALQGMTDDQKRLFIRGELTGHNKQLAEAAQAAGVPSEGFASFQNHGYRGLYAGETAAMIAKRKGLKRGQDILDHMGSEELAANLFRATQADAKLRRETEEKGPIGQKAANKVHNDMGKAVRQFILDQGGTPPEQLPPPAESIKELQKKERQRLEEERQSRLFTLDSGDEE
jgi:DNA-damage-inducible protein D